MSLQTQVKAIADRPQIIWAPIRHHSPQCSWQLQNLIAQQKPDVILIEGPSEANHLLPFLTDKEAKAPLAIYIYAVINNNHWPANHSQQPDTHTGIDARYRCFIPMAPMSPEWVAIQSAAQNNIPCHFIDLPYSQRLEYSTKREVFTHEQDHPLYDDRLLAKADIMTSLLQQSHCRDFDEWWDRYFESGYHAALSADSAEKYFQDLLHFCLLLRHAEHDKNGIDQETLAREAFMADQIRPYLATGKRCLIVCGGFHCQGIHEFLEYEGKPEQGTEPDTIKSAVHLVPYSLKRLNNSHDYAAGMPDCGFYDLIWSEHCRQHRRKNTFKNIPKLSDIYPSVIIELANKLAKHLQQNNYLTNIPDIIETVLMSHRLADLRGYNVGRPEFRDAITSCFFKQAQDTSEHYFIHLVNNFLAGDASGRVPGRLPLAPLVEDFRQQCRKYRLPLSAQFISGHSGEKQLDIYRSERHRNISRFLHQLRFLQIPYGKFISGPLFASGKDLNRVREKWQVNWHVETETQLVECSHYGDSLMDAALNRLVEQLHDPNVHGAEKVKLLVSALSMGLHNVLAPIVQEIQQWLQLETQVIHLCDGFHHLTICFYTRSALGAQGLDDLQALLINCFNRICIRLPWLGTPSESESEAICDALCSINGMVVSGIQWCDGNLFFDALKALLKQGSSALVIGVCAGALYSSKKMNSAEIQAVFTEAFSYASLKPEHVGTFLRGFLLLARGSLLADKQLLILLNKQLMNWSEQEFLHALPSMRLAFSQLSPREIRILGQLLTTDQQPGILPKNKPYWSQQSLQEAFELRQQLELISSQWGI